MCFGGSLPDATQRFARGCVNFAIAADDQTILQKNEAGLHEGKTGDGVEQPVRFPSLVCFFPEGTVFLGGLFGSLAGAAVDADDLVSDPLGPVVVAAVAASLPRQRRNSRRMTGYIGSPQMGLGR